MIQFNLSNDRKLRLLAISIGIIYLWFGMLKFFPGHSPAEGLAIDTISRLFNGIIPDRLSIVLLAIWEVVVGILLIINFQRRIAILLALLHMILTFSVFFLLPEVSFSSPPLVLSLIGQYVIKNLVIISALLILYPKNTDQL